MAIGFAYAVARSSYTTGQDIVRDQPVPFSHRHHVGGLGLDCRCFHTSVETARRVHDLPGYVYFDHSVHVAKGVGCSTCHGRVDQMQLMR